MGFRFSEHPVHSTRRQWLQIASGGVGAMAMHSLLQDEGYASDSINESVMKTGSARPPHFMPRAKRMIWLFMHGGPSQVDLFDPKPELAKYSGQPLPESFGEVMTRRKVATNPLLASVRPFRPRGNSGLEISDFLPHLSRHADDLCVIRSLHGDSVNHPQSVYQMKQSVYQMNTGSVLMGHPSFDA